MAMTPYSGDTSVIGKLGTTPQERGLTTQQFKDKFDEGLKTFVEWFNETHNGEINEHMADYAAHGGIYHKNILHNWYFRNPVNQRGFTHSSSAGYTIDRWRLTASEHAVEVVSDGIKLIAGKNAGLNNCFVQLVENYSSFVGVPLTLSIHIVENTLTQGCNLRWNDYASPVIMGTGYFSFTFTPSSLSYLQIGVQFANRDVDDGKYVIIDKMKLEIGNVSTLANDPPADYGEQLALCECYMTTDKDQTMAAKLKAHNNTDYTTAQVRNIILSDQDADPDLMQSGDIWIKYTDEE